MGLSLALQLISERATPLPLDDIVIEGLEDFKTIAQFDERGNTVAFVSHPGWQTHLRISDRGFRSLYTKYREITNDKPENCTGGFRARLIGFAASRTSKGFLIGRHVFYEQELFDFLAYRNVPTIVTVQVSDVKDEDLVLRRGKSTSNHLVDYLRGMRGDRDNFYLLPTYSKDSDNLREATGYIFGDLSQMFLDSPFVFKFLEAINGRRVLVAGSNLSECIKASLGYFMFVDCEVRLLVNYFGLSREDKEVVGEVEYVYNGEFSTLSNIRANSREMDITHRVKEITERVLAKVFAEARKNSMYLVSRHSSMTSFDGYVDDLKI
ncbi:hypothetical protein HY500_03385 [Candidatus Woesearchaeota archaeon]|nr:hypothetical protein [Candidatus Woesearchaeota archaeon]